MILALSASGNAAPTLFVFNRVNLPAQCCEIEPQTYADLLLCCAFSTMRENSVRVDLSKFYQSTKRFVESMVDLHANGRHFLFASDRHDAHMSLSVLKTLSTKAESSCTPWQRAKEATYSPLMWLVASRRHVRILQLFMGGLNSFHF